MTKHDTLTDEQDLEREDIIQEVVDEQYRSLTAALDEDKKDS